MNQPLRNLAEPLALAAVDNDEDRLDTLSFELGREFERFVFSFRTWLHGSGATGKFKVHRRIASRVQGHAREYGATSKVESSIEPVTVRVVVTRGAK